MHKHAFLQPNITDAPSVPVPTVFDIQVCPKYWLSMLVVAHKMSSALAFSIFVMPRKKISFLQSRM